MADSEKESNSDDELLPLQNVIRIMRKALPAGAKISKDAKDTMQLCALEFISWVVCEASLVSKKEHRQTMTADDLLVAMKELKFDDYVVPLNAYLEKFRGNNASASNPIVNNSLNSNMTLFGSTSSSNAEIGSVHPETLARPILNDSLNSNVTTQGDRDFNIDDFLNESPQYSDDQIGSIHPEAHGNLPMWPVCPGSGPSNRTSETQGKEAK